MAERWEPGGWIYPLRGKAAAISPPATCGIRVAEGASKVRAEPRLQESRNITVFYKFDVAMLGAPDLSDMGVAMMAGPDLSEVGVDIWAGPDLSDVRADILVAPAL